MHYMTPIPKAILNQLGSEFDKLILLSFNEAMNLVSMTGSKAFMRQITSFLKKILGGGIDTSMNEFARDFVEN